MQNSFTFIEESVAEWHIDEQTKNRGLQGIAAARRTLESCRPIENLSAAA